MIKSVMDYFISSKRYAEQKHSCTECGREIGENEFCMTDGEEMLICCRCVNDWIGRERHKDCTELVEFLEVLSCDACECPDDTETRSQTELDKLDTESLFGI
ncbi:MAG: hypothetical protein ACI4EU_05145 [Butyrivibrio sp.]